MPDTVPPTAIVIRRGGAERTCRLQSGAEILSTVDARTFPFYRFAGTHREIGRQFGEATAEVVRRHRDLALTRLDARSGVTPGQALVVAMRYQPWVVKYAPFLDEEIQGLAEGAGLSLAEAYLLQLRAELAYPPGPQSRAENGDECTTFALLPEATADGSPLIGQNADLPAFYSEIGVIVEIVADDAPRVLMLTPAGQVSYIGINDQGLGILDVRWLAPWVPALSPLTTGADMRDGRRGHRDCALCASRLITQSDHDRYRRHSSGFGDDANA